MPSVTRWFIKSGLLYFVAALLVGVALGAQGVLSLPPVVATLSPIYLHLLMVGWITQLIFGVAYWMFPTYSKEHPYRSERLAMATFVLLNVGLILRAVAEPLHALQPQPAWGWLLAFSAVLQWLAGVGFVVNTWSRVRPR